MSEKEPFLRLNWEGDEIVMHRGNSALFKFLGGWATHDHIFVAFDGTEDDESNMTGGYIFKDNEEYQSLAKYMIDNKYILHINLPEPNDMDKAAFDAAHYNDLRRTDTFPEAWIYDERPPQE